MYQKLICLILLLFSGLIVNVAGADITSDLVAWWALDSESGITAKDSAGHPGGPHDGTLQNGPQWENADIMVGTGALRLDGLDDRIVVESFDLEGSGITIAAWIKPPDLAALNDPRIVSKAQGGGTSDHYWAMVLSGTGEDNLEFRLRTDSGAATRRTSPEGDDMQADEWAHIAVTWDASDPFMRLYKNGEEIDSISKSGTAVGIGPGVAIGVGNQSISAGADSMDRPFPGILDDVRVYERGLSAEDITELFGWQGIPVPSTMARNPIPSDGILIEDIWVNLSWTAGDFAVSHDVYLGDNLSDVNEASKDSDVYQGNQTDTFIIAGFTGQPYPDGLVPGTTYYWRIDEVNVAEPNSPWKGDVWSFTVPPTTAYSPDPADGAESVDLNVTLSWTAGFDAKLHTVYFGENYDDINNADMGVQQGDTSYTTGPLELAKTYYWRIDEFDGTTTHRGNIWSFTTVGAVADPNPSNGAVDVEQTPNLTWTAGVFAASHEVYFGDDAGAVAKATKSSPEYKGIKMLGDESYDPGELAWETTYYWRIDEVNSTNADSPWLGKVWSFTTADFAVIDDFESYDGGANQIWYSWHDGLGYGTPESPPYFAGNGTGSAVGDETTASYTEETIVHGGNQSMPLSYDNNKQGFANYSQVELTLTRLRDWTIEGIGELSLWFHGDSANSAESLYVAVSKNDGTSAVVIHNDPAAAQIGKWTEWIIPLTAFTDQGLYLTGVDSIAIGLGTRGNMTIPGGSGKMYFDDIRLYRPREAAK